MSETVTEYVGIEIPHIALIMDRLSSICPPFVYPKTGPRDNPRLPVQAGRWTLGSYTSPSGAKQANFSDAGTHGQYFVGDRWPTTMTAPQSVCWIPPNFPDCRYVGNPDRIGNSRGESNADLDFIRSGVAVSGAQPLELDGTPVSRLTADSPQAPGISFRRIGALVEPWTVLVWGNDRSDTWLLQHWIASISHDTERSQAERTGEQFTATAGGWDKDRPGDRGLQWRMVVKLSLPIVRSEWNKTVNRTQGGTFGYDVIPGSDADPLSTT